MNLQNITDELIKSDLKIVLLALAVGLILGFIFVKLKLPIPAPPSLAGVIAIVGIWLGYLLGK